MAIFRDSDANALDYALGMAANAQHVMTPVVGFFEVDAVAAVATTFKLRAGPRSNDHDIHINGNTLNRIGGGVQKVVLEVEEIRLGN